MYTNEWKDEETGSSSKGLVGKPLKLSVSCNSDTEEGAGVVFRIYPEGANPDTDQPIAEIGAENKGGKAEGEWTYIMKPGLYKEIDPLLAKAFEKEYGSPLKPGFLKYYAQDSELDEDPTDANIQKCFFVASAAYAKEMKSGVIEIFASLHVEYKNALGKPIKGQKIEVIDPKKNQSSEEMDSEGKLKKTEVPSGIHAVTLKGKKG